MTRANVPVLLIEDNKSEADLTRRAFEKAKITNELIVVEDGQEALDYLNCEGTRASPTANGLPALILLDLKLPKVPGLEVLRRIRLSERTRRLPVVVLTTSVQDSDMAAAYDLGVNSYIRKPVDFGQFAWAIQQIGSYWLSLNEAPPP